MYRGVWKVWKLVEPNSPRDARSRGSFACRFQGVLAANRWLRWGKPIGGQSLPVSSSSSLARSSEVGTSRPVRGPTRSFALFEERARSLAHSRLVRGVNPSARPQSARPWSQSVRTPPVGSSVESTRPHAPSWLVQLERTIRKLASPYLYVQRLPDGLVPSEAKGL